MTARYTMEISLNVLEHLGIGLYSNVPAVLSEAVANAWDADAETVAIDAGNDKITIEDDGEGMSVSDANNKYLCVGYRRRKEGGGKTRGKKRPVMGRKGIGKLSLFSIAGTVTIHSTKDGHGHGFRMNVDEIEKIVKGSGGSRAYHPEEVPADQSLKRGTRITLTDLKKRGRRIPTLRKRLARRFTVIGGGFNVSLNGERITAQDRGYQDKLQYAWTLDGRGEDATADSAAQKFTINADVRVGKTKEPVGGWIGTVKTPSQLKDADSNQSNNRIAIIVRGKMAQEDMMEELGESGVYSAYVVGEVHADFMDTDGSEDIATTNRQKFMEDDPRYEALRKGLRTVLKSIESKWTDLRNEGGTKVALELDAVKEWYGSLPDVHRPAARKLFGRINTIPMEDGQEKKRLFMGGILAFETLKYKSMLDKLDDVDLKSLNETLAQLVDLEATAYYQITKNRLGMIARLDLMKKDNVREKVIQKHIVENLWLLDPTWAHMQGTERMETAIKNAINDVYDKLDEKQKRSRLDIKYTTTGKKHVIIELKRPRASLDSNDVLSQIQRYSTAIGKVLEERNEYGMEIVCVVGTMPKDITGARQKDQFRLGLEAYHARIVTYDELIQNAENAYQEYLKRGREVTRINRLINNIERSDMEAMSPS